MKPTASAPPVWTEPLRIGSNDVDFTHQATSASLCQHFLEAAWNHAEALGVGFAPLAAQGRFWVLSRLLVEVWRYPKWGTAAALRTWPRPAQSAFALRDFEIVDDKGERMAAGSSAWLVLDAASKRPQRLGKLLPHLAHLHDKPALRRNPEKLADAGIGAHAFSIPVRYMDIDVNAHVNSGRYIRWILDAYPSTFHRQRPVRLLEINYLGETLECDLIHVRTRQTGPAVFCHSLTKDPGEEVCRARLEWGDPIAAG